FDTKRYASVRSVLPIGWTLLYLWLFGLAFGGLQILALLLLLSACAIYALYFVNLGMWLSLATRSTVRAALLYCVCVLAFPAVLWGLLAAANKDLIESDFLDTGLYSNGCRLLPFWTI